jgi:phage gp36-like protein
MAFITDEDYEVQARNEILKMLDDTIDNTVFRRAEHMAIDQIKSNLAGRYDLTTVFDKEGDERNMFIVMTVIDMALYHIWAKKAPRQIPEVRKDRYQDAIDWLTAVSEGKRLTDLPRVEIGGNDSGVIIKSLYTPNGNKF